MTCVPFESLPPGVWPLRDYPSLRAMLVECDHAETKPLMRVFVSDLLPYSTGPVMVTAETAAALASQGVPEVELGPQACRVCGAIDLARPVKMLALYPGETP